MSTKDDGGPAFPDHVDEQATYVRDYAGMSLRDYFAGQALAGLLATTEPFYIPDEKKTITRRCTTPGDFAQVAYLHADAMIVERRKG